MNCCTGIAKSVAMAGVLFDAYWALSSRMGGDGWRICRFVSRNIQVDVVQELVDSQYKIRPGADKGTAIMRRFVASERSARGGCQTHDPAGYRRLFLLEIVQPRYRATAIRIRRE